MRIVAYIFCSIFIALTLTFAICVAEAGSLNFREAMTGEITRVNARERSFTLGVTGRQYMFSAAKLLSPMPAVGDFVEVTFTQISRAAREATAIKLAKIDQGDGDSRIFCRDNTDTPRCCKRNGGYWVSLGAGDPGGCNFYGYWYRVTRADSKNKTFTAMVGDKIFNFKASNLKGIFPRVGDDIDVTYTISGGAMFAVNLNTSRSNIY